MRRCLTFALNALILIGAVWILLPRDLPDMQVTALTWPVSWAGFGGWSGLEIADDGKTFWIVSDSGTITRGTLQRENGTLTGVKGRQAVWIDVKATEADPQKDARDAESLARLPTGLLCIGFERNHRLICRPGKLQGPHQTVDLTGLKDVLLYNGGIEALAFSPDGDLLAIPEGSVFRRGPAPLYQRTDGVWQVIAQLPRSGIWLPAGADVGPDGHLYLLEHGIIGYIFTSRVRRFDLDDPQNPDLVFQSRAGRFGNLEGLGVWRDTDGMIRLTMISDDNGEAFLDTQIVEVVLTK
ncbi:esterase-like activity of phytase family protein [Actibacterium sp. 188UL27-1]|uniref:esterase-like activity of phytase family protein n=1 Tax=Actibacterium sp. 188UL27-1 TaxID=2786961 RepID=UPI00195AB7DD|nr:esterase-like activity of phytase family protein [Actibacterium sp. 188UL27-1]MBM7067115.1 esterase-like activity of phytase family protein [Actibacterium sp. 188UL27-1]